jgi:hypothetical protein
MGWDEYKAILHEALRARLAADDFDEPQAQRFLEQHPCLVPYATRSGYHARIDYVYTQVQLGPRGRIPDFVRLSKNSSKTYLDLVEIESPAKRLFTKAGQPGERFVQARQQLSDWSEWLRADGNRTQLREYLRLDRTTFPDDVIVRRILVMGRRDEVEKSPRGRAARGDDNDEVTSMTWDRVAPDEDSRQAVTIRMDGGVPTVRYVPATFTTSRLMAPTLRSIEGWESAIERSLYITEPRKAKLISRVNYWRGIAATHGPNGWVDSEPE